MQPTALFDKLVPFFLLAMDHAAYSRTGEEVPGNWDTWLNVMNVEIENGLSERKLYGVYYGEGPDWDNAGWRQIGAFSACVLKPLEWAGFITIQETREADGCTPTAMPGSKTSTAPGPSARSPTWPVGNHARAVQRMLEERGVWPIFDPARLGSRIYRQADVAGFMAEMSGKFECIPNAVFDPKAADFAKNGLFGESDDTFL